MSNDFKELIERLPCDVKLHMYHPNSEINSSYCARKSKSILALILALPLITKMMHTYVNSLVQPIPHDTYVVSNLQVFWQYSDMAYVTSKFKITNRSNSKNVEGACHVPPADQVVRRWSPQVIDLEFFSSSQRDLK